MGEKVQCSCCNRTIDKLEMFPNEMCLSCYEMEQNAREKAIGTVRYMEELRMTILGTFGSPVKGRK